ncbi:MAG: long-chain-fatty-acid--CoA ligase [Burkholderiales bacterium]|nr:long-chain-fatty-acid--CoA ligase [Burkholderiales bacterium]
MQRVPLSIHNFLTRAGTLYRGVELVSRLPDKSVKRTTYGQFHDRALALAAALVGAGLKRGDRVATLCWNHHWHLEAYFGIPAAGGVMHTLNLRLSGDEIAWIANHARDRFLIVDDILLPLYEQFRDKVPFEKVIVVPFAGAPVAGPMLDYEAFIAGGAAGFVPLAHDEDDPIAMCYTSGTTGRPKGVVYSHRSTVLHSLVASLPDHWGFSGRDSVLPVTPMFHANCWGVPYAAVMMGIKLIFPGPHLHAEDLLDLFHAEQPTYSLGVPTIWLSMIPLLEANDGRWKLHPDLRTLVGGAAMPEAAIRKFAEFGIAVAQGWGMTETSPMASMAYIKPELQHLDASARVARYACAGVPTPVMDIRIMGDAGVAPWDGRTTGELQVRGPYITGGYHEVPTDPEKFTDDGFLRTGDVASIDEHGYIRIADRTKDLVKSGGEWISSVDLENALMAHPAIAEAAVIAVPHPRWTERPLACVVFRQGRSATPAELNAHLAPGLAKWQLPDAYVVLPAIPRTSTGKFWKMKLREMYPSWEAAGVRLA